MTSFMTLCKAIVRAELAMVHKKQADKHYRLAKIHWHRFRCLAGSAYKPSPPPQKPHRKKEKGGRKHDEQTALLRELNELLTALKKPRPKPADVSKTPPTTNGKLLVRLIARLQQTEDGQQMLFECLHADKAAEAKPAVNGHAQK